MKRLFFAAVVAAAALATGPASAAMLTCTGANMAKSISAGGAMVDGPTKWAMMKEMGVANSAMAKGNMPAACKSYMKAQKIGATKA